MRDWGPTVTCAMLVLAVGLGARWVAGSAWESVVLYRSPYRFHARLPAGPRLAQRVILRRRSPSSSSPGKDTRKQPNSAEEVQPLPT